MRFLFGVSILAIAAATLGCEDDFRDEPADFDRTRPEYRDGTAPLPSDIDLPPDDLRRDELRRDEFGPDARQGDDGDIRVRWPGGGVDVDVDRIRQRRTERRLRDGHLDRDAGVDIDLDRIDEEPEPENRRIRLPDVEVDVRNR